VCRVGVSVSDREVVDSTLASAGKLTASMAASNRTAACRRIYIPKYDYL